MMQQTTKPIITDEMKKQFDEEGYFILPSVVCPAVLENLRGCLDKEIQLVHQKMDKEGTDQYGITHRNKRYFISNQSFRNAAMYNFAFSELMFNICKATLGDKAFLFFEQFVVKSAKQNGQPGMSFAWHQDSGYIRHSHPFYLSCWVALDDMTEENGTLRVLPYKRGGGKNPVTHFRKQITNDMVGYVGEDKGELVCVPAGSVVVFSSFTLHCSGENNTDKPRRSYLTQYSSEPIMNENGDDFHALAIPFIENGVKISKNFENYSHPTNS